MTNYAKNYKFDKVHEELYDNMVNAKPILAYKKKQNKAHNDALSDALKAIKVKDGEDIATFEDGLEKLVDAYVVYKKKAGLPIVDDKKHRHHYAKEVEDLLEQYGKQTKEGKKGVLRKMRNNEFDELVNFLAGQSKAYDQALHSEYHLKKILKEGEDDSLYEGLANVYAARRPTVDFTKGDLKKLANRDALIQSISQDLSQEETNVLNKSTKKKAA